MAADEIVDRLYELRPDEFTGARNQAAAELRKAGRREEADRIKGLRKPTAAAAAANRLVRVHRAQVEEFLAAATGLRDAQFAGRGDLAAATKRERQALDRLIRLAGGDVRQTLQAAAVDDEAAAELLRGRLERELEPRGFGTLLAHATPRRKKAEQERPKRAKPARPDDRFARTQLREAKEALAAAREHERRARGRWKQMQEGVDRAEADLAKAQRELDRLRGD